MRKLAPEEIGFIDKYLENSEVKFYDIRLELVDHVAKAVEEKMDTENLTFYDAFKSYMIKNKKELIKEVSLIKKEAFLKVLKMLGANLFHPITIGVSFLGWLFTKEFFNTIKEGPAFFSLVLLFLFLMLSLVIMRGLLSKKNRGKQYIYINRLVFISSHTFQLYQIVFLHKMSEHYLLYLILYVAINSSFLISLKKVYDNYQKKLLLS
ncbi:hypothetical protein [Mesonia sp. K7]|uniref:hypothetical protein n=1 Tax=Mesonia sp. K7 TaxID=2218606 RepID=UPI000DA998C9|nr:hypothetical protein [Mesonia sp. K7]PZD79091.1 hypothetical protein DNG35_03540 [Mesonia sp. K7]